MRPHPPSEATVVVEPLELELSVEAAVTRFATAAQPAILESSHALGGTGRYSILACNPIEVFSLKALDTRCPFQALSEHLSRFPSTATPPTDLPFLGGWIGFISYEACLTIEGIAPTKRNRLAVPAMRFALYDVAAVFDHNLERWSLVAVDWPGDWARRRPSVADRLADLRACLVRSALSEGSELFRQDRMPPQAIRSATPNMSHSAYLDKVARVKEYIEAGDVYQVNLTQRFTTHTDLTPLAMYHRLRRVNPAEYAAFLLWDHTAVLSSSPELFLKLKEGHVVTKPIKGTRPRGNDVPTDAFYRRELAQSEKDRAELTMIVDLLRNDLGRVCSFGSVHVAQEGEIEELPTVFHRVATIKGKLKETHDWSDLLRAAVPGGSVTGAPKIRAMQIIDELEPTPRGIYCGAIGMIGLDGSLCLNLAIRTMTQCGNRVDVYAGGAIVADSQPQEEYDEIMVKAKGMFQALACQVPAPCLSTS